MIDEHVAESLEPDEEEEFDLDVSDFPQLPLALRVPEVAPTVCSRLKTNYITHNSAILQASLQVHHESK